MARVKSHLVHIVVACLLLALPGCGKATSAGSGPESAESGTIAISGAWALYPMMVQWAEAYQADHPGVLFDISAGGAGKGMADALANAVDIGMVSRAIYPEEEAKGAFWVSVVTDAVFLTVNEANPVWQDLHSQGVTREDLVGIFITGEVTTWGQVVDNPAMTDPIHVYTRSDAAGAPATWAEYLGKSQEDLLGVGVYGDPGLLDAVIKDPLGMGYNNLNYAYDMETGLPVAGARVVPLDVNADGQAGPAEQCDDKAEAVTAVAEGNYPSPPARDLNLVTQGPPTGLIRAFILWILGDGQQFVPEAGYISLTPDRLAQERGKLE